MKYDVGITIGVFDLFHVGHLNLLERCKQQCDHLIVGVCDDQYVMEIKNKNPIFDEQMRLRIIGALKCVDEVSLVNTSEVLDKTKLLDRFKFNVLFSGSDWIGSEKFIKTERQFKELGLSVVYFPYTPEISTTKIRSMINKK